MRNALQQTFPQVKVVVDAPVQMERELALLRQAAGTLSARDLEPLLAAAAQALPLNRQPTAIDFSAGELRLRGIALSDEEEAATRSAAQALGYRLSADGDSLLLRAETLP